MEVKVSMTISVPGAEMYSEKECITTVQKEIVKKNKKTGKTYKKLIDVKVEDREKYDKNILRIFGEKKPEFIEFYTRKNKPATHSINLGNISYDYMISNECPSWCKQFIWNKMNKVQRLEEHLKRIADNFNGTIISYKVFDD